MIRFRDGHVDRSCLVGNDPSIVADLADALDRAVAALNGMVGLVQLLAHNDGIPALTRMGMVNNHRVVEAKAALREIGSEGNE